MYARDGRRNKLLKLKERLRAFPGAFLPPEQRPTHIDMPTKRICESVSPLEVGIIS